MFRSPTSSTRTKMSQFPMTIDEAKKFIIEKHNDREAQALDLVRQIKEQLEPQIESELSLPQIRSDWFSVECKVLPDPDESMQKRVIELVVEWAKHVEYVELRFSSFHKSYKDSLAFDSSVQYTVPAKFVFEIKFKTDRLKIVIIVND